MKSDAPRYRIEGYTTPDTSRGYDAESEADTVKEARAKARHLISEDYRQLAEASGRLSYARVVDTQDGSCVFDLCRDADPALERAAYGLAMQGATRGLYAEPRIEGAARFDNARTVLGYPADGIELRDAYGPEGEGRWVKLTPDARLFNQAGEPIKNPLAPVAPVISGTVAAH